MKPLIGTVVVENIGGGGASIGAAAVARAQPDGYTILLGGTQTHVNEALLKSRPLYDPVKDLDPIAGIAANVLCIAVHPSVPVRTLEELIAYAKANPGKLSYGHAGVGSIQHLTGELFKSLAGTPGSVDVPYRGTGPLVTDLISGQVPMGTPGVTNGFEPKRNRTPSTRTSTHRSGASGKNLRLASDARTDFPSSAFGAGHLIHRCERANGLDRLGCG